jgi:SAM-dependent methyltransferase
MTRISNWEKQYHDKGFKAQRLYPNEELVRFLGINFFSIPRRRRKNINILELGCGSGANLWMIAREGFEAHGIDLSPSGIRLCRQMLKKWNASAQLTVGSMLSLPYEDDRFDAVVDVVSSQHLAFSDHAPLYREVARVLRPGGLFFSYHLGSKSYSYRSGGGIKIDRYTIDNIRDPRAPLANNGLTCFPSGKAVERTLKTCGLETINIENVIKSYEDRTKIIQYLVIKARKP